MRAGTPSGEFDFIRLEKPKRLDDELTSSMWPRARILQKCWIVVEKSQFLSPPRRGHPEIILCKVLKVFSDQT